jgi:uncharacterized protein
MAEADDRINDAIQVFIREAGKKYHIVTAYIYGSFSKGTAKDWSDIDLALVSPDFADDTFEDRVNLMRIAASIDDRIEPHPFNADRFNRNDPLADEIQKEGTRIL